MSDLTDDAWAEGLSAPMSTDLDAAVARLKRDLATPGTVTGCVVDGDHLRLLLADWERLRGKTYCAYCGHETLLDDAAATKVGEHIKVCAKHPLRAVEAERDAARAEVERLKAEAATADRMYIENHERFQALAATSRKLGQERDRLQSIFEATMADLHDPQHDKTSVFWRMNAALAQYAKEFP